MTARLQPIMKMLAAQIERELETETATIGHCAIYQDQLPAAA
jgi:hypothetical protein